MKAKIYQPAKTAMQSGNANVRHWIVEYEPVEAKNQNIIATSPPQSAAIINPPSAQKGKTTCLST